MSTPRRGPTTAERAGALAGIAAPAVSMGAILAATLLAPDFSWTADALSDLG